MQWNKLRDEVHKNAVEHGWWERPLTFSEIIVMCHSELSEAVEEYRAGRPMVYNACGCNHEYHNSDGVCAPERVSCPTSNDPLDCPYRGRKPEGVAVELADCILRILDYMGQVKGDVDGIVRGLQGYAPAQEKKGDGKPLPDLVAGCHYLLSSAYMSHRHAEMLGKKKEGKKIQPARTLRPFRTRDFERIAREKMIGCILDIMRWAKDNGVDMEAVIISKNEYNKTREYRHGGKRL